LEDAGKLKLKIAEERESPQITEPKGRGGIVGRYPPKDGLQRLEDIRISVPIRYR
jgi:hypothetical protein